MNIFISYIFELWKYELDRKKIIAVINTTYAVVKKKKPKVRVAKNMREVLRKWMPREKYFNTSNT